MKAFKTIHKWAALRHPDKQFEKTARKFYKNSSDYDRMAMMKEFEDYINGVEDGSIIPGPIELPKDHD